MKKIPAASAMGWSIEFDKGLRSKRPGEDKLFFNAINLLRLADALRLGDNEIKTCIAKIFVQELKGRRKRRRSSNKDVGGIIFSKNMIVNYLEILRRVKLVFDNGDVEERALALALFGCWADLTKDCADIRYVLLSCLGSGHILEVKAALFAARCLCELAHDFAYVLLEVLVNMMLTSSVTSKSLEFKLAVGRAFARMSCSFPISKRAYEIGSKLLLDSCEEQIFSVMLISLTKIASKWILLIPGQIDLLLSFLSDGKDLQIQATTVRCLDFILARGLSSYPATSKIRFHNLFNFLRHSKFPPALLNKTLKVLHKILLYNLPSLSTSEISYIFSVILTYTKEMIHCSVMPKRILVFHALVDLTGNPLVRAKESTLLSEAISLIVRRISTLVKSTVDAKQIDAEMEQEVTSLLNLVRELAEKHSDVSSLLLDKFCIFIVYLGNMFDMKINRNREDMIDQESSNFGRENITKVMLQFSLSVTKTMMICVGKIEVMDIVASQALNSLKLLVENIFDSVHFESHTLRIDFLLLQFDSVYSYMCRVMGQVLDFNNSTSLFSSDSFCDHGLISLKCAKKIIEGRDY